MKRKEEENLKDLFKGETIPEYNAKEAFENFERKFPLNDSYKEESFKPKKRNRFKWLYWVPAVATALVVIPISCLITNLIVKNKTINDYDTAYKLFSENYEKVVTIQNCYFVLNNKKQSAFVFYCEDENEESYFATYAYSKYDLTLKVLENNHTFTDSKFVFEKKLDNLNEFTYYFNFEGSTFEYTFNPQQFHDYLH